MIVAVIGGCLQGAEAAYLARKAGWETVLVDKRPDVPASGLSDHFLQLDVTRQDDLVAALRGVDLVIPAMENQPGLNALTEMVGKTGIPIAFDPACYALSSSKIESNRLFKRCGVPVPLPWPQCGFPMIAKPNRASGSSGVRIFAGDDKPQAFDPDDYPSDSWVLEEFVPGPSYSLEVLGSQGGYFTFQVTDLHMDHVFDCKRVTAPTTLSPRLTAEFERISARIAAELKLEGIMDVEVILADGKLKVLEIDARIPSQTPTAVYWSTGINLLELMGKAAMAPVEAVPGVSRPKGVVYEHIGFEPGRAEICGEHIMSKAGPLSVRADFLGADEAITDYAPGRERFAATLIFSGPDLDAARAKRQRALDALDRRFNIGRVIDSMPGGFPGGVP